MKDASLGENSADASAAFAEKSYRQYVHGLRQTLSKKTTPENLTKRCDAIQSLINTTHANLSIIAEFLNNNKLTGDNPKDRDLYWKAIALESIASEATRLLDDIEFPEFTDDDLFDHSDHSLDSSDNLLRKLPLNKEMWPVLLRPRPGDGKKKVEKLKKIGVGALETDPEAKRSPNWEAVPTLIAKRLLDYMMRAKESIPAKGVELSRIYPFPIEIKKKLDELPQFNPSSSDEWLNLGLEIVHYFADGDILPYAILSELGEGRSESLTENSKNIAPLKRRENETIQGVKNRLRQAFKSLSHQVLNR